MKFVMSPGQEAAACVSNLGSSFLEKCDGFSRLPKQSAVGVSWLWELEVCDQGIGVMLVPSAGVSKICAESLP